MKYTSTYFIRSSMYGESKGSTIIETNVKIIHGLITKISNKIREKCDFVINNLIFPSNDPNIMYFQ